jgi:hypothetical protein
MTERSIARQVEAFRLMWDAFPEPAMLVGESRKVLAANALARRLGVRPGCMCGGLAPLEVSAAHNPMERLQNTRSALVELADANGWPVLSYWVPVAGAGNMAVHFGIGVVRAIERRENGRTCNKLRANSSFAAGESFE